MIEVDDDAREVDAVLGIAATVMGLATLAVVVAGGVVVGAVMGGRALWRKLCRIRGW